MKRAVEFVNLDLQGRALQLEYQWLGADDAAQPLLVFFARGTGIAGDVEGFPAMSV